MKIGLCSTMEHFDAMMYQKSDSNVLRAAPETFGGCCWCSSIIIPKTTKEMKKEKNAHRLHKKVFDSLNSFWRPRKNRIPRKGSGLG